MAGFLNEKLPANFWDKVQPCPMSGCWLWVGAHCKKLGYGTFSVNQRSARAYRVSYAALVGPIPEGLSLDHLCRVPACVNPAHLEPVTHRENCRRGVCAAVNAARHTAKTHCPYGHAYDEANTYIGRQHRNGHINRLCRACARARSVIRRALAKQEKQI